MMVVGQGKWYWALCIGFKVAQIPYYPVFQFIATEFFAHTGKIELAWGCWYNFDFHNSPGYSFIILLYVLFFCLWKHREQVEEFLWSHLNVKTMQSPGKQSWQLHVDASLTSGSHLDVGSLFFCNIIVSCLEACGANVQLSLVKFECEIPYCYNILVSVHWSKFHVESIQ
jgi:hypothetical protein